MRDATFFLHKNKKSVLSSGGTALKSACKYVTLLLHYRCIFPTDYAYFQKTFEYEFA